MKKLLLTTVVALGLSLSLLAAVDVTYRLGVQYSGSCTKTYDDGFHKLLWSSLDEGVEYKMHASHFETIYVKGTNEAPKIKALIEADNQAELAKVKVFAKFNPVK